MTENEIDKICKHLSKLEDMIYLIGSDSEGIWQNAVLALKHCYGQDREADKAIDEMNGFWNNVVAEVDDAIKYINQVYDETMEQETKIDPTTLDVIKDDALEEDNGES